MYLNVSTLTQPNHRLTLHLPPPHLDLDTTVPTKTAPVHPSLLLSFPFQHKASKVNPIFLLPLTTAYTFGIQKHKTSNPSTLKIIYFGVIYRSLCCMYGTHTTGGVYIFDTYIKSRHLQPTAAGRQFPAQVVPVVVESAGSNSL
jgi:hypothetical protein